MAKIMYHSAWPLTIFILAIVIAILGIVRLETGSIFMLLAIFLICSAIFVKIHD